MSLRSRRSPYHVAIKRLMTSRLFMTAFAYILMMLTIAISAPVLPIEDPNSQKLSDLLAPPSYENPMGLDEYGRSILSRIIYGARVSLMVGITAALAQSIIGAILGGTAGYCGGTVDNVIMRLADIFLSFPSLVLAIGIMAVMGRGTINMVIAITLTGWPVFARTVRSEALRLRESEFVQSARANGASGIYIVLYHIIPNAFGAIVVLATIGTGWAILNEAGLSFLGLGISPPTPSWGTMIAEGRQYLFEGPHLALFSGSVMTITLIAFSLLGDELRDALDPRMTLEQETP